MNEKIGKLITGEAQFDKKAAKRLARELKKHPYSQVIHALHAKALMKTNDPGFEEAVNKASACAPDQRVFRAFLSDRHTVYKNRDAIREDDHRSEFPEEQQEAQDTLQYESASRKKSVDQQAIIDRFLEIEPRISSPRDDVPEGELAPESLEESDDLISETLAEVLVKQGKKERAIDIFQKLSLKFPEKSSYFAKKIESIQ